MTPPRIRVVKVGGSLLQSASWPHRLSRWLQSPSDNQSKETGRETPQIDLLLAGGGTLVEQIRQFDRRFQLPSETTHWASIHAMSITAGLLAAILEVGQPVADWEQLQSQLSLATTPLLVVDAQQWLARWEPTQAGVRLSRDWDSTSDSIAGRLAHVLPADELVLLKSTDNPYGRDWRAAAAAGIVDRHFPRIAAALPQVRWVNLQSDPPRGSP